MPGWGRGVRAAMIVRALWPGAHEAGGGCAGAGCAGRGSHADGVQEKRWHIVPRREEAVHGVRGPGLRNGINTVDLLDVLEGTGHALIGARQWIPREDIAIPQVVAVRTGLPPGLEFRTKGQLAAGICADAYADGGGSSITGTRFTGQPAGVPGLPRRPGSTSRVASRTGSPWPCGTNSTWCRPWRRCSGTGGEVLLCRVGLEGGRVVRVGGIAPPARHALLAT